MLSMIYIISNLLFRRRIPIQEDDTITEWTFHNLNLIDEGKSGHSRVDTNRNDDKDSTQDDCEDDLDLSDEDFDAEEGYCLLEDRPLLV